jgi:prepilin-type processing-associated H-X9-DG protein
VKGKAKRNDKTPLNGNHHLSTIRCVCPARYPTFPIGDVLDVIVLLGLNRPDPSITEGPAQFVNVIDNLVDSLSLPFLSNSPDAFSAVVDKDRNVPAPHGNGGGTTVYRLREGIERFLITDINNPAASAKAQSEIFVMWDNVSTKVEKFNHVPGGSNVLYMDGHVEFVKYPSEAPPVDRLTAAFMDVFDRQG